MPLPAGCSPPFIDLGFLVRPVSIRPLLDLLEIITAPKVGCGTVLGDVQIETLRNLVLLAASHAGISDL